MGKTVLITGATSGIGKATALLLSENGYNLILTGRRNDRLAGLKSEIESKYKKTVLILNFDIRNREETEIALQKIKDLNMDVDILINNAGLAAGLNDINDGLADDWERMIDTNIKGLLYISRIISQWMVKKGRGHIINISSIAGKETYPMGNVYCATKHAVQSLTKGMRLDLLKHGIKVTSVCPGAVETEFSLVRFNWDRERAEKVYSGFTPLYANDIADTILFVISRPDHVNIDDILVMPAAQAYSRDFNRK
ncbi:MAG: SDR family NAD(P)-dependent oxidoreductase [Prolixibacteraceae bacterium]|nr:SDR family NAD(P)-dependent oxidoreductase [Prolixibacteraceae bacterium]NLO04015.1 SDR family NAD(P)-dependent oxidoreductase [Bacteroidales bacterium]